MRRRDRSGHRRRARYGLWRGGRELYRRPSGHDARYRGAIAALRRPIARFQGAEADRARKRAAEDRAWQARPQGAGEGVAKSYPGLSAAKSGIRLARALTNPPKPNFLSRVSDNLPTRCNVRL